MKWNVYTLRHSVPFWLSTTPSGTIFNNDLKMNLQLAPLVTVKPGIFIALMFHKLWYLKSLWFPEFSLGTITEFTTK